MLAALDKRKGSPGFPSSSFFQGQGRGGLGPVPGGTRGAPAIQDACLLGRRMAVWRGNGILMEPGQGRSGTRGQNASAARQKNYAVRIGKRGGGNKLRTSGSGGQESRPGADLGRPGSGNGPSEEGQSMRRGRKGAGTTGTRAFGRGGSRHAAGPWAQKKPLQFPARAKYGGPSGTRTPNQLIKSQLLYQLS